MTNVIDERVLDPSNETDRTAVRQALIAYVDRLSSAEIVDLLIALRNDDGTD